MYIYIFKEICLRISVIIIVVTMSVNWSFTLVILIRLEVESHRYLWPVNSIVIGNEYLSTAAYFTNLVKMNFQ